MCIRDSMGLGGVFGDVLGGSSLDSPVTVVASAPCEVLLFPYEKQVETDGIGAGDIGAVAKLVSAKTGDTPVSYTHLLLAHSGLVVVVGGQAVHKHGLGEMCIRDRHRVSPVFALTSFATAPMSPAPMPSVSTCFLPVSYTHLDNCRPASLPGGYGFPRRIHS